MARKQESTGESTTREATNDQLYAGLLEVRFHGPHDVPEGDVGDELSAIVNLLCPDGMSLGDRIVCALKSAVERVAGPERRSALAALYGLDEEWTRAKHDERRDEAIRRAGIRGGNPTESYNRRYRKAWTNELAEKLRLLAQEQAIPRPILESETEEAPAPEPAEARSHAEAETATTFVKETPDASPSELATRSAPPEAPTTAEREVPDHEAAGLPSGNVSEPEPAPHSAERGGPQRRSWYVVWRIALALAVVVAIFAVISLLPNSPGVPKRGTVIDAVTGKATSGKPIPPETNPQMTAGANVFRACIAKHGCIYPPSGSPLRAHPGDIVRIRATLENIGPRPLPYVRIVAFNGMSTKDYSWMNAQFQITAPNSVSGNIPSTPFHEMSLDIDPGKGASMEYVSGSTELLGSDYERIARLPDGIFDKGIDLARVGSPRRIVQFDVRIV